MYHSHEEILERSNSAVKYLRWCYDFPGADVGVVTGRVSGLCVLVVEDEAAFKAFATGKTLPVTPTVVTPTGTHYWFCLPENITIPTCTLAHGVELRGEGSFVPVPTHPKDLGGEYQWALGRSIDDVPLAPLPDWILEELPPQDSSPPCDLPDIPEGEGDCGHPTNSEGCADDGDGNLGENPTSQKEGREEMVKYSDLKAHFKDLRPSRIPAELKAKHRWAVYRVEEDEKGRKTKVPYIPPTKETAEEPLRKAKANDPSTWTKFGVAWGAIRLFSDSLGLCGPVFAIDGTDDIIAIDVDYKKCEDDTPPPEAEQIFNLFVGKTYLEFSPSRKGFHVFLKAKVPPDFPGNRKFFLSNAVEVEVFVRNHFISVTGWVPEGGCSEINECQGELDELLSHLESTARKSSQQPSLPQSAAATGQVPVPEDEIADLVEKIRRAAFGEKVKDLFEGRWEGLYPSWSEADLGLCSILARHTRGNADAIDAIVRLSRLYRPKWDERHSADGRTYGEMTIEKALAAYWQSAGEGESEGASKSKSEGKSESKSDDGAAHLLPPGFVIPEGYAVTNEGIFLRRDSNDLLICRTVVYVSEIFQVEEINDEFWMLRWRVHGGKWRSKLVDPKVCLSPRHIVDLCSSGIKVQAGNEKHLVRFLDEFAHVNNIPTRVLYPHYGWVEVDGERKFVLSPDEVYPLSEAGLRSRGDFAAWRKQVEIWRQEYPLVRFVLAVGFAAPLLHLLGERSFILHLYGKERVGKTASARIALSVWGDPHELYLEWFATKVGIERTASLYAHLPIVLDELRSEGRAKQDFFETVPYMLTGEKSKIRGDKSGGLEKKRYWRTIFISSGEEALTTVSTLGGFRTRILEIYAEPFESEEEAEWANRFVQQHHGHAGALFIQRLYEVPTDWLEAERNDIRAQIIQEDPSLVAKIGRHTLWYISTIALADFLASMWIWGVPIEEARKQAIALALHIARLCAEEGEPKGYWLRALEDFASEISRHGDKVPQLHEAGLTTTVEVLAAGEIWGVWKGDFLWVFPTAFKDIVRRLNYDYKRVLREWEAQGIIRREDVHYTVPRRISGKVQRVIEIQWDIVAQHLKLQGDSFSAVPGEPREEYPF